MMMQWHSALVGRQPCRSWLIDDGSLTAALKRRCPNLQLRCLRQATGRPYADEYPLLGLAPKQYALVRDILFSCHDRPVVFAHSVIPRAGLVGPWHSLLRLGNRPLGEILFADPSIVRHPLQYRRLDRRHPLYRSASLVLGLKPRHLWARRSIFSRNGYPILVTEVFLPDVLQLDLISSARLQHGGPDSASRCCEARGRVCESTTLGTPGNAGVGTIGWTLAEAAVEVQDVAEGEPAGQLK